MAGYQAVLALRRLEEDVDKLGFMLCAPKCGSVLAKHYSKELKNEN